MQGLTFIRTTFEILFNNPLCKTIASFVNFCNEQRYYNQKELKFLNKMPINNIKSKYINNKFVFDAHKAIKSGLK